tara:strand:+ start:224 stop:658 length:435 start_codon:yes stop_codon:yes gene_type:complete
LEGESNNVFILFLLKNKLENFFFFLGFVFAVIGYSFWKPVGVLLKMTLEESYNIFFVCIAAAFFFYTFGYFLTKYKRWRFFPMFVYLVCLARVGQQAFWPDAAREYDWIEYANFLVTGGIVLFYWLKYKHKQFTKIKKDGIRSN